MTKLTAVFVALAIFVGAVPASAITLAFPPPWGASQVRFAFDSTGQIIGFVNTSVSSTDPSPTYPYYDSSHYTLIESGAEVRITAPPSGAVLYAFQMYTFTDAGFDATLNGTDVSWTDITDDIYNYYDVYNLALQPGENVFVLSAFGAAPPPGYVGFGTASFVGLDGPIAIPAPAPAFLLAGAFAMLTGLRRRRSLSPPARR